MLELVTRELLYARPEKRRRRWVIALGRRLEIGWKSVGNGLIGSLNYVAGLREEFERKVSPCSLFMMMITLVPSHFFKIFPYLVYNTGVKVSWFGSEEPRGVSPPDHGR